ncbi:helix-turn-helix domain-containing protein, partial [Mycobacterium kansasii]
MSAPATMTGTVTDTEPAVEAAILTAPEAAEAMRVHLQTVQALIRRGELRAARVGRVFRIKREWLDQYLDRASATA